MPDALNAGRFVARPLRASDAAMDHAAYVASPQTIRIHSGGRWPTTDFSVADNRVLAEMHEREHLERRSFTFMLLTPARHQSVGCLYLMPLMPFCIACRLPRRSGAVSTGERRG